MNPKATAFLTLAGLALLPSSASAFEHQHAIGTGYHFTHVAAHSGGRYNFHSIPVTYHGRYGGKLGGAFRFSLLVPLLAQQGSTSFFPGSEYNSTLGFDMLLGPSFRWEQNNPWEIDGVIGAHFNYIRMTSDEFVEWSTATAGFGFAGNARGPVGQRLLGGQPVMGFHLETSLDPADFSRNGDLQIAVQVQLGVSIGIDWARKAQK